MLQNFVIHKDNFDCINTCFCQDQIISKAEHQIKIHKKHIENLENVKKSANAFEESNNIGIEPPEFSNVENATNDFQQKDVEGHDDVWKALKTRQKAESDVLRYAKPNRIHRYIVCCETGKERIEDLKKRLEAALSK